MRQWGGVPLDTQVPWWMVVSLRNRFYLRNFVETGAGYGDTSIAASHLFQNVYSVELCPGVFRDQFEEMQKHPHIRRECGTSVEWLEKWLPELTEPTLFYLDSHWPGLGTKLAHECPLLAELDLLIPFLRSNDIVMIDNAGMFIHPPRPPHDPSEWPSVDEIQGKIGDKFLLTHFDVFVISSEPLIQGISQ